jgi:hypothetical protein
VINAFTVETESRRKQSGFLREAARFRFIRSVRRPTTPSRGTAPAVPEPVAREWITGLRGIVRVTVEPPR